MLRKEVCHEKETAAITACACIPAGSFSMLSGFGSGTGAGVRTKTRTKTSAKTATHGPSAATATIPMTA
jgi:hypothetical protein